MSRILIPTDFSPASANSVSYGLQLAQHLGADIELLHIIETYTFTTWITDTEIISPVFTEKDISEMMKNAQEAINRFIEDIPDASGFKGKLSSKIRNGNFVVEVFNEAVSDDVLMVLVSSGNSRKLVSQTSGINVRGLLRQSPKPVFIVPDKARYSPMRSIIINTEFKESDVLVLRHLMRVFNSFNPDLTLLHVRSGQPSFDDKLRFLGYQQFIANNCVYPKLTFLELPGKDVVQAIIGCTEQEHADLLVVQKQSHNFLQLLFESDHADKLARLMSIPMISYTEQ